MRPCFKARMIKRPRRVAIEAAGALLPRALNRRACYKCDIGLVRKADRHVKDEAPRYPQPGCGMRLTDDRLKQDGFYTRFPNRPGAAMQARVPMSQLHRKAL